MSYKSIYTCDRCGVTEAAWMRSIKDSAGIFRYHLCSLCIDRLHRWVIDTPTTVVATPTTVVATPAPDPVTKGLWTVIREWWAR